MPTPTRERKERAAPDDGYLKALRTEVEEQFRLQDQQIDRLRKNRTLNQEVALDAKYRIVGIEVRDPKIADEIQDTVTALGINGASLNVKPAKEGIQKADANATDREHWTEEVLRKIGSRKTGPTTLERAIDAVAGDGGVCTKLLYKRDIWDERYGLQLGAGEEAEDVEKPEGKAPKRAKKGLSASEYVEKSEEAKRAGGPPFEWLCVDIRTVYPIFQGSTIGEVLEVQERPRSSCFRQYRLGYDSERNIVPEELGEREQTAEQRIGGEGMTAPSTVLFLEHWDDKWVTYYVCGNNKQGQLSGQKVDQWEHGYGRHPYFFALGITMNWWTNRKVGWSISESKRWLVEYRSFLWTIHAQQAARDTLPPIVHERPDTATPLLGDDGKPKAPKSWELMQILEADPGDRYIPLQFPQVAQSLREQLAIVNDAIDNLSAPSLADALGDDNSGFNTSLVLGEMRKRYNPLATAIQRMLDDVTRFLWHLVRTKVRETVWVDMEGKATGWKGMGPDDLEGNVRTEWKLDPEMPSAKLVEARYWHERISAGTASEKQAVEAMGDNWDEVQFQRAIERMMKSLWYQKYQDEYVTQQIGRGELVAQAYEAQQMAATGMIPGVPGAGAPGVPGGMGNGMVPDLGALAAVPGGGPPGGPVGPGNGAVIGGGPGAVVTQQGGAAGITALGR